MVLYKSDSVVLLEGLFDVVGSGRWLMDVNNSKR